MKNIVISGCNISTDSTSKDLSESKNVLFIGLKKIGIKNI